MKQNNRRVDCVLVMDSNSRKKNQYYICSRNKSSVKKKMFMNTLVTPYLCRRDSLMNQW